MISELNQSLEKAVNHLRQELAGISVGRANAALIDEVSVEVYGSSMPLKNTANISCPDSQTIRIEPWDKTVLEAIEKGIIASNTGMMPQNMGECILLKVPLMTEERRRQIVKKVHDLAENSKISIRNIRQDYVKKIKHQKDQKEISEDEAKHQEKQVQEKIDETNKMVDEIYKKKEADILSV